MVLDNFLNKLKRQFSRINEDNNNLLLMLLFFSCLFSITRQYPFIKISEFIIPMLFLLFIAAGKKIKINVLQQQPIIKNLLIINISILVVLIIYSLGNKNDLQNIIRFFSIIVLMLIAYVFPKRELFVRIFVALAIVHSFCLIMIEINMMFFFNDLQFANAIRGYFINSGVGDVYSFNGFFYLVQIKGNAILPIALFISIYSFNKSLKGILSIVFLLLGVFIAGNFAFLISTVFYLCIYLLMKIDFISLVKKYKKKFSIVLTTFICILLPLAFFYVDKVLDRKSGESLPTRYDQVSVLIENMIETPSTILFGQGLGNTISKHTEYRDYTGDIYYELQALYILNQVGVIYFLFFIITTILLSLYTWKNKHIYLIYLSYILYGFTNPYIFDSLNILIIIVLNSLTQSKIGLQEGNK
jgi:hypothetical protein